MPKKAAIRIERDVSLHGRRIAERYDDDDLAVLAEQPIEKISLLRQHITKLPPIQPGLRSLWIGECPTFASLDGIEQHTTLQRLWLTKVPALDLARVFELCAELPELTELRLGGAELRILPRTIAKLPSLLSVDLEDCLSLDFKDAFAALGTSATLRHLRVRVGPKWFPDELAPLAQLSELTFTKGYAETFMPSIGALTKLRKLVLTGCAYKALPATIGQLQSLEELHVKDTALVTLPDELCECAELQVLDVDDSQLKTLPAQIGRLQKLRELRAWTKKLRTLPDSIGDLAALRELRLHWEKVTVPDSIYRLRLERFTGPKAVEAKLTMRPPPTPQVDRLYLYETDRIPDDFGDPKELEIAMAGYAEPLPQLARCPRLEEITIEHGNLGDVLARLADAPKLRSVIVQGEFTTLPDTLGGLAQIASLSIDSGPSSMPDAQGTLGALPDAIGHLVRLEELKIKRHAMTALPDALGKLAGLRGLSLRSGAITTLPDVFDGMPRLERLSISIGELERLPASLAECSKLAEVDLYVGWATGCRIANLVLLGELRALRKLSMPGMPGSIEPVIDALGGSLVEDLDLTRARLTALPASIGELSNLRTLKLDGTELTRLPPELRACSALRWISVPFHRLDDDLRKDIKPHLPKGRWKKQFRSSVYWFERSDV